MYTGGTPEVHRMHKRSSGVHPVYFRCTSGVHGLGAARAGRGGLGSASGDPHLPSHAVATWRSPSSMVILVLLKIHALAKITDADCKFVDEYMTKYSQYEHSQPDETPIPLPAPQEIESDLKAIVDFIAALRQRKGP
jgi:hypothetical protein